MFLDVSYFGSRFCIKDQRQLMFVCFLELNLNVKQDTAKERTHLFLFIKCIKKIKEKKARGEKLSRRK